MWRVRSRATPVNPFRLWLECNKYIHLVLRKLAAIISNKKKPKNWNWWNAKLSLFSCSQGFVRRRLCGNEISMFFEGSLYRIEYYRPTASSVRFVISFHFVYTFVISSNAERPTCIHMYTHSVIRPLPFTLTYIQRAKNVGQLSWGEGTTHLCLQLVYIKTPLYIPHYP